MCSLLCFFSTPSLVISHQWEDSKSQKNVFLFFTIVEPRHVPAFAPLCNLIQSVKFAQTSTELAGNKSDGGKNEIVAGGCRCRLSTTSSILNTPGWLQKGLKGRSRRHCAHVLSQSATSPFAIFLQGEKKSWFAPAQIDGEPWGATPASYCQYSCTRKENNTTERVVADSKSDKMSSYNTDDIRRQTRARSMWIKSHALDLSGSYAESTLLKVRRRSFYISDKTPAMLGTGRLDGRAGGARLCRRARCSR